MATRTKPITIGPKRTREDALRDAEMRSGKASRVMSLSDVEKVTGYDRGTVTRWISRGMPIEGKGAKGATLVDLRALIEWREEQARIDERKKFATPDEDGSGDGDEDRELKREQIVFQKIKTAEKVQMLVPSDVVLMSQGMVINSFRTSIDGLANRIERECLVGLEPDVIRSAKEQVRDTCRAALAMAQNTMERDFRRLTRERLEELGADTDAEFDAEDEDLADAV